MSGVSDYPPAMPPYDPSGRSGPPAYGPQRDHPQATTALVLGILGIVVCFVLAPVAWVVGGRAVREIDASHGALGGRGSANAGRILGIVGTLLVVLGLVVGGVFLALLVVGGTVQTEFQGTCTHVNADGTTTDC
jgi:hypothetical protein